MCVYLCVCVRVCLCVHVLCACVRARLSVQISERRAGSQKREGAARENSDKISSSERMPRLSFDQTIVYVSVHAEIHIDL